jgi:hypothetical protein
MRTQTKQWLAFAFAAAISGSAFAQAAGGNSGGNGIGAGGGNAGGAAGVTVPGQGGANQGWNRSSADTGYGSPGVTGMGGGQGTGTGATPNPANRSMSGNMQMAPSQPNGTMQNNGQ